VKHFSPKLYVASRTRRAETWKALRDNHGFNIISTWIDEAGPGETKSMTELWLRIFKEVKECDGLILYLHSDDLPLKGALVEVGAAIALGKLVCVVCEIAPTMNPDDFFKQLGSWQEHPLVTFEWSFSASRMRIEEHYLKQEEGRSGS
jgi:nucleoside 2-deoxyribosyltransferase